LSLITVLVFRPRRRPPPGRVPADRDGLDAPGAPLAVFRSASRQAAALAAISVIMNLSLKISASGFCPGPEGRGMRSCFFPGVHPMAGPSPKNFANDHAAHENRPRQAGTGGPSGAAPVKFMGAGFPPGGRAASAPGAPEPPVARRALVSVARRLGRPAPASGGRHKLMPLPKNCGRLEFQWAALWAAGGAFAWT
jgi:hypothetical protein